MGKVIRSDKDGVQKVRARDIVPGDIVEVSGEILFQLSMVTSMASSHACVKLMSLSKGSYLHALWPNSYWVS